jgi:hypothetical protein
LATRLPPGDLQLLITGRGCACGLYQSPDAPNPPDDDGAEGSEADFEQSFQGRDIAAIDEAAARIDRRARRRFRETVAGLTHSLGTIRLFAHHYEGDVSSEAFAETASLTVSVNDYLANHGAFPADTIVTLTSCNKTGVPTLE